MLELNAVLAPFDGVHLYADNLDVVLVQYAGLVQLRAKVQTRLTAQIGQKSVGTFLFDDLGKPLHVQRLYIGDVCGARISHDGGRVGVDQDDLVPKLSQSFTGLGAGIVKFTRLTNDDGAGANDEYFVNVIPLHTISSHLSRFIVAYQFYTSS